MGNSQNGHFTFTDPSGPCKLIDWFDLHSKPEARTHNQSEPLIESNRQQIYGRSRKASRKGGMDAPVIPYASERSGQ